LEKFKNLWLQGNLGEDICRNKEQKRCKKTNIGEENPKEKLKVRVPLARCPFVLQT